MNQEEKIISLLQDLKVDVAVIKERQENHIDDYEKTKKSHYELRDEHKSLKAKVVIFSALIGSGVTLIGNYIKNLFTGHN